MTTQTPNEHDPAADTPEVSPAPDPKRGSGGRGAKIAAGLASGLIGALLGTLLGAWLSHSSASTIYAQQQVDSRQTELRLAYVQFFASLRTLAEDAGHVLRPSPFGFGMGVTPSSMLTGGIGAYSQTYVEYQQAYWTISILEDDSERLGDVAFILGMTPSPGALRSLDFQLNASRQTWGAPTPEMQEQQRLNRERVQRRRDAMVRQFEQSESRVNELRNELREWLGQTASLEGAIDQARAEAERIFQDLLDEAESEPE